MRKFTVGSLFSGIGGLDLGLERAGWEVRWQVENNEWCTRVLAKHWPDVPRYGDIKELSGHDLEKVDLIAGGFPCQPVSVAGKRKAQADSRWLWPEFLRIVSEVRPRLVLVENVPGLLHRGMAGVIGDLSSCGYNAEWGCLSAADVGAPHLRERVFIVAHSISGAGGGQRRIFEDPQGQGWGTAEAGASSIQPEGRQAHHPDTQPSSEVVAHTPSERYDGGLPTRTPQEARGTPSEGYDVAHPDSYPLVGPPVPREERNPWTVEPNVGRVAYGIPSRVDRLRGLGNAVVPQVAEWIGRKLLENYRAYPAQPVVGLAEEESPEEVVN